jgi:V/A-type H+-transporting ATPase subunit C
MIAYEEADYAHAVARCRALEGRLLRRADLERLLEAPGVNECWKTARDLAGISENLPVDEFEAVLGSELARFYAYVSGFLPDSSVPGWLLLRYDYHHLKVLMKEMWLGEVADEAAFSLLGNYPVARLRQQLGLVESELPGDAEEVPTGKDRLPPAYRHAIASARQAWEEKADAQVIDLVLDRCLFAAMAGQAPGLGPSFQEFVAILADLANLKILLRCGRLGKDRAFLREALVPGGAIPGHKWLELGQVAPDRLFSALGAPYAGMLQAAQGDAGTVERLGDNHLTAYLRKTHYVAMGREPVLALLWAKEGDIRNLRIAVSGKLNGMPGNAIRERLRDCHV